MTKVYFACSIRGGGDTSLYQSIVDAIKKAGGDVLSEVFVHDAIEYIDPREIEDAVRLFMTTS